MQNNHSPLIKFSPVRALKVEGPAKPKLGGVSSDFALDFLLLDPSLRSYSGSPSGISSSWISIDMTCSFLKDDG